MQHDRLVSTALAAGTRARSTVRQWAHSKLAELGQSLAV
jgi:hypothetical protein